MPSLDGAFLHPFDCTKFIKCTQGDTSIESCPSGTVFSISRQNCIQRDQVDAYDRVEYGIGTTNEFSHETSGHSFGKEMFLIKKQINPIK